MHHPALLSYRRAEQQRLICLLLIGFVFVRSFTPQGFMPSDVRTGAPFTLCHGDAKSAFILKVFARESDHGGHHLHHHGHQQAHQDHDEQIGMGACEFGAATLASVVPDELLYPIIWPLTAVSIVLIGRYNIYRYRPYELFFPRSPPLNID